MRTTLHLYPRSLLPIAPPPTNERPEVLHEAVQTDIKRESIRGTPACRNYGTIWSTVPRGNNNWKNSKPDRDEAFHIPTPLSHSSRLSRCMNFPKLFREVASELSAKPIRYLNLLERRTWDANGRETPTFRSARSHRILHTWSTHKHL